MGATTQYFCLQPAKFKLDGGAMFGIIPRPLWEKVAPPDEYNRIELALRLLVKKTKTRLIVIDTGIGDYHDEKFDHQFAVRSSESPLELSLKSIGYSADDVTNLILSHLHFDHAGGIGKMTKDGKMEAVFKKATLHLHRRHYEYAQKPTERDGGSFLTSYFMPVIDYYNEKKQIHWLDGDEGSIIDGTPDEAIRFLASHGHTPHLVHPYDQKFIYLADIVPTSRHVHIPWVMAYDMHPGLSTQDKRRILGFVAEKNLKVVFEHDPEFWGCSVQWDKAKDRFSPKESFKALEPSAYAIT